MDINTNTFLHSLEQYGDILCLGKQEKQFADYLALLNQWNQVHNLTAITDVKDQVIRHLNDSLAILPYLTGMRVLDVGSGAGFPGIPLAIIAPDKQFVLLDKNQKKIYFLNHVIATLQLQNVTAIHARVEEYEPSDRFDVIVTRAFSSIREFIAVSRHLCANHGIFLAMKGVIPKEELKELPKDVIIDRIVPLNVKGLLAERHLVILRCIT